MKKYFRNTRFYMVLDLFHYRCDAQIVSTDIREAIYRIITR